MAPLSTVSTFLLKVRISRVFLAEEPPQLTPSPNSLLGRSRLDDLGVRLALQHRDSTLAKQDRVLASRQGEL